MFAWGGVQTTSIHFRQMMEISSRLFRFTSISFLSKEAIKMRPAHLWALLQLENAPACSISSLISNNHPMLMELPYLGPQGSESDRSDSWDCHSRSSPFHRHLQHISPRREKQIANQAGQTRSPQGHAGPFMNLRAAGHEVFFLLLFNYLYLLNCERYSSALDSVVFPVGCSSFYRQICTSVILFFAIFKWRATAPFNSSGLVLEMIDICHFHLRVSPLQRF